MLLKLMKEKLSIDLNYMLITPSWPEGLRRCLGAVQV